MPQYDQRKSDHYFNLGADVWFRFLHLICPDHLLEDIEGDIIQKYFADVKRIGKKKAQIRLRLNIVRVLRPGILLRNNFNLLRHRNLMLRNHTKVVLRQASQNKAFSLINLMGLTLGIAACLFIAQFVWFESSFERFNERADRTYRVNLHNTRNGVFTGISAGTVSGLAYSIKQLFPAIESVARVSEKVSAVVATSNGKHEDKESNIVFADAAIVDILDLDFIEGDKAKALRMTSSLIISASAAKKYFGDTHAVGEMLEFGFSAASIEKKLFEVQGVFQDIPQNSHQHFDFVLPPDNEQAWNENWAWSNVTTYVVLPPNLEPPALELAFSSIVKKHHVDSAGDRYLLELISDIRLYALNGSGRASTVRFFIILGVVILFLAWFNYVSLSTARFFERMKEVGIRKMVGASRFHLILQVLMEALIFNTLSFSVALVVVLLSSPFVSRFLNEPIPFTLIYEPSAWLFSLSFIIVSSLSTGFYPAAYLSSFKPLPSLKGFVTGFGDRATLRKTIVVAQVFISILLITAVSGIQRQLHFMQEQDLGISMDQTLIIEEPLLTDATTVEKYKILKRQLQQLPDVKGVTYASTFSGSEIDWHRTDITLGSENAGYRYDSRIIGIGTEFLQVFGLPLLAGRNFNEDIARDQKAMLLSEAACEMFGFIHYTDALGKLVFIGSRRFEIIGVVKNYHYRSLQNPIQPILYIQGYPRNPRYAVKLSTENVQRAIADIESKWKNIYRENVFRYFFLDDFFDKQYASERQAGVIVTGITILAIFISCAGLFALSLYTTARKTREIGIRKVFGATVRNVVILLTKDFVKLAMTGGVLAVPAAYVGMNIWLERYAFKMRVDSTLFILPVALVWCLTLLTISFQTIGVAKRKPVESMRYE